MSNIMHNRFMFYKEIDKARRKYDENYNTVIEQNEKLNFRKKFEKFYNKIENFKNQKLFSEFMNEFSFRIDILNKDFHAGRISKDEYLKKLNHIASQLEVLISDIKNPKDIEKYVNILLKSKK